MKATLTVEHFLQELKENQAYANEFGCTISDIAAVRQSLYLQFGLDNILDEINEMRCSPTARYSSEMLELIAENISEISQSIDMKVV